MMWDSCGIVKGVVDAASLYEEIGWVEIITI